MRIILISVISILSVILFSCKYVDVSEDQGVVYFGLMVHLEGWSDEMNTEVMFDRHAAQAMKLANVFEKYDARVTFEANWEFVAGCESWNNNILQNLYDRGHGIGVHADVGGNPNIGLTQQDFVNQIRDMKVNLEHIVDFDIQHVSGICSHLDWAKAAIDAGYVFTTGGVGYCVMSMPENMRPTEYKNCPSPSLCHGEMPLNRVDRIHPWKVSTAISDWTIHDPDGELVIMSSDGGIKNLYEVSIGSEINHETMVYSDEDIDVLIDIIEDAINLSDANKVNQLYLSLSIGKADVSEPFYNKMFETLIPYVDAGQLEYKSINDMYEEYISSL